MLRGKQTEADFARHSPLFSSSNLEMTAVTGGRTLKLSSYSFALITPLLVENEDDRPGHAIGAAARRVLRVAQLIEVDHLRLRVGEKREGDIALLRERLEDFGTVIRERGDAVASLLDLRYAAIHVDQLRLTIGAPIRRAKEHENHSVLAHHIGQCAGHAGRIEADADIGRDGADRRAEILGGRRRPWQTPRSRPSTQKSRRLALPTCARKTSSSPACAKRGACDNFGWGRI